MTAPRPLRALVGVGASLTLAGGLLLGGLPAQADETPAPTAPTATAPVVPADTTVTRTYPDGAAATMDVAWAQGRTLHVSGTGFFAEDGKTPSTIAIKLTSGTDKLNNGAATAQFQTQADGTFSVELPYPTIANGGAIRQGKADSSEELKIGEPVGVNLLTGSLQTGDRMRGGPIGYAAITAAPAPTEDPTPEPTTDPTTDPTGEPTPVPSTEPSSPAPTTDPSEDPTPEPSETPTADPSASTEPGAQPSASASTQPEASASPTGYQNCRAVWDDLGRPIHSDEPGYSLDLDADRDGIGCEQEPDYTSDNGTGGYGSGASGSGTTGAGSASGLASTGLGRQAGLIVSGGLFVLAAGTALVVFGRRRSAE